MGLWDRLRGLVHDDAEAPLDAEAVRAWYASLPAEERARWSERIRAEGSAPRAPATLRSAKGRLLFSRPSARGPVPLHHLRVELWDRDPGAHDDFLGAAQTDADGRFTIAYDPRDAGPGDEPDLELRALEPHHTWDPDGSPRESYTRIFTLQGPDDVVAEVFDFGDVHVPFWEYDPHSAIPRLHVPAQATPPEGYAPGRALAMFRAVDPIEVQKRKHLALIAVGRAPSLDAIQADYPPSLTVAREAEEPGATRTGAWFGERVLNGFFSSVLDRDWDLPDDPDAFRIYHPWNAYEQDGEHCFPSVDIRLRRNEVGLEPTRITLAFRAPGARAPMSPAERVEVTPDDGARWRAALRFARVSATYEAELSNHLAQCHLNVEQYAIAARRNLRASPLRALLIPHLREVAVINHAADDFLLGATGYVIRAGALTPAGVAQRLLHAMGGFDWKGFRPQPPVCPAHRAARAGALFWDLLGEHVDAYLAEHREAIAAAWVEVRRMSDDLVAHAVPRYACSFVRRRVVGQPAPFFQRAERADYDRASVDGKAPALSPLTTRDAPEASDWEDLAQLCRYVLFFATFRHAWANNLQWDDGGEVRYANLGLRWADGDPLADDDRMLPTPAEATEMLWISWLLSKTSYGAIVNDEDRDVHPRLVRLVRARREELAALGLDVDRVCARINI